MDHLFAHEGEPLPDLSAAASTPLSGSATQPVATNPDDGDDEDIEALRHLESTGADAKVHMTPATQDVLIDVGYATYHRASSVPSVARYSRTQPWPTSMLRKVDMINSKSLQRK